MVTCIDISKDLMVTGCRDGKIYKWNVTKENGKYKFVIEK